MKAARGIPEGRSHLVVIHYGFFAGPHNRASQLAGPLAQRGWRTRVLIPGEDGSALARFNCLGVSVRTERFGRLRATANPATQLRFARAFWRDIHTIQRVIREERPDVVLLAGLPNPHAAIAARREGVPVLWQIVDTRLPFLLREPLMVLVRKVATVVMFNGCGLETAHTRLGKLECPSYVYYPPVDMGRFFVSEERRNCTRSAYGISRDAVVIGMVANWNEQKGIEYFVRAAAEVYAQYPDVWFLTVGRTYPEKKGYTARIRSEIRQSGIPPERFLCVEGHTDVEVYYPAMDIKVITSVPRSEGTTTTAIEAQACGVPVVTTDVGAVAEAIADGETGFVVPPLDPPAVTRAVLRLLGDRDLRLRFAVAARRRAAGMFDIANCADVHAEALDAAHRCVQAAVRTVE